jgi:hypothetical protein
MDAVGDGSPLGWVLCRGRTGVRGSGRLRVLAVLGERLRGLGIEGPVVVSFMERRAESEGAESEGVRLCVFVGRGAILFKLQGASARLRRLLSVRGVDRSTGGGVVVSESGPSRGIFQFAFEYSSLCI